MKICHIVPISYLPILDSTPGISKHLALAPLVLSNKTYCEFYSYQLRRYYGVELILDNGVFENPKSSIMLPELALAAHKLFFSETTPIAIVLPDVYLDGPRTISLIRENTEKLYDLLYSKFLFPAPNLMGVVQGKTKEEMLDCFNSIVANPLITQIGIPHEAAYRAFTADHIPIYRTREWAIEYLVTKSGVSDKVFHCLGLMGHPVEVFYLARLNRTLPNGCEIISLDTSAAFVHAWNRVKLSVLPKDCGKAKRPENFFDLPFKQDVADLFSEHVHWMNQAVIDGDLVVTDPLDLEEKREPI